ncbi:MAG: TIGR02391 family protein [Dehalococcoidia bacterium]
MCSEKAIELLQEKAKEFVKLLNEGVFRSSVMYHYRFHRWCSETEYALIQVFGEDSRQLKRFLNAAELPPLKGTPDQLSQHRVKSMMRASAELEAILSSIEEYGIPEKYEILGLEAQPAAAAQPPSRTTEVPDYLFDKMQLHLRIITASKSLFESGHYAQAIFEAFKAVENFVQDKSGSTLYGTNLMERVFNEEDPIIKVPEAGHYYKEVQKGFKHLFVGASQGIRNPKAHKEIIQKDPYITLQYLGFFSFLLKRIDYWETGVS